MDLIAILGLATLFTNPCSWDKPGFNPYTGTVENAVHNYQDIPPAIQDSLIAKIKDNQYDDLVSIKKDSIEGNHSYNPDIKDMHFGKNRKCAIVTRNKWSSIHSEPAKVYCESSYCIAIPNICNNVSRVTRYYSNSSSSTNPGGSGGYGVSNYPINWYKPTEYSWVEYSKPPVVPIVTPTNLIPPSIPGNGWINPGRPVIIPSVPEPEPWKYFVMAGIILLIMFLRRNK